MRTQAEESTQAKYGNPTLEAEEAKAAKTASICVMRACPVLDTSLSPCEQQM